MKIEELEKRIHVLEDIEEIKKVHRKYIFGLEEHRWLDMLECFAENAIAEIGFHEVRRGKKEISGFLNSLGPASGISATSKTKIRMEGQYLFQPVIAVAGDKANGHWIMDSYFDDPSTAGGPTLKVRRGRYEAEYIRENGNWKINYLKWIQPWPKPE
jgi:hypothetical protein